MVIIESLDADTETRRLSPVAILGKSLWKIINIKILLIYLRNTWLLNLHYLIVVPFSKGDGYVNLLNGPMDHGWCLGYTCQERISAFYGIVASHRNYSLYFSSTNPQKMRFHLLAEKRKVIRFAIFYKTTQRLDIYRKGKMN